MAEATGPGVYLQDMETIEAMVRDTRPTVTQNPGLLNIILKVSFRLR